MSLMVESYRDPSQRGFPLTPRDSYTGIILNYIWRKRAGARWLRIRNEDVTRRFGSALAIIERPRGERVLLEISCQTKERARKLVREFGGSVEKLRPGWLQRFTKQAQAKPLRIG